MATQLAQVVCVCTVIKEYLFIYIREKNLVIRAIHVIFRSSDPSTCMHGKYSLVLWPIL